MKYKDYYEALGVPRDATLDQIKKAYRKLARENHPDVSDKAGGEARFKEVAEAYATLKDPEKRAAYDELGRRPQGQEFQPPPGWSQHFSTGGDGGGAHSFSFDDVDLSDLFAQFSGGGRGSAQARNRPMRGEDYEAVARTSLEDAHRGATVQLEMQTPRQDALGRRMPSTETRTLQITIPKGTTDGQRLRLRGKGGQGLNGGEDGDIYLRVELQPHPVFRVDGHDLYFDLPLAPWEAALGAEVQVPTLDGPVVLTVPEGTRAGRKLRVKKRGLASSRGELGDLYAVVTIDVPGKPGDEERKHYEALAKLSSFNPRAHLKG